VLPKGDVQFGFRDFDLDVHNATYRPVAHDILIQHLTDNQRYMLMSGDGIVAEERIEDYLVRGLIDCDEIKYEEHAELLYKLAGQMVRHLQPYLSNEDDAKKRSPVSPARPGQPHTFPDARTLRGESDGL
jgi:type III restriction enzyme